MARIRLPVRSRKTPGVLAEKHLAASPLPAEMVHVIDVADEIRLFEADDVPVFVGAHFSSPTRCRHSQVLILNRSRQESPPAAPRTTAAAARGRLGPRSRYETFRFPARPSRRLRPRRGPVARRIRARLLQALRSRPDPRGGRVTVLGRFAGNQFRQGLPLRAKEIAPRGGRSGENRLQVARHGAAAADGQREVPGVGGGNRFQNARLGLAVAAAINRHVDAQCLPHRAVARRPSLRDGARAAARAAFMQGNRSRRAGDQLRAGGAGDRRPKVGTAQGVLSAAVRTQRSCRPRQRSKRAPFSSVTSTS